MRRTLGYFWALPATTIGLAAVAVGLITGGKVQVVRGVVEVYGGWVTRFLKHGVPLLGGGSAMTLGHVVLGQDRACLQRSRDHEHVHVRQYERWGPFFLPAYLGASAWLYFRGRHPYWENPFEREAYDREP